MLANINTHTVSDNINKYNYIKNTDTAYAIQELVLGGYSPIAAADIVDVCQSPVNYHRPDEILEADAVGFDVIASQLDSTLYRLGLFNVHATARWQAVHIGLDGQRIQHCLSKPKYIHAQATAQKVRRYHGIEGICLRADGSGLKARRVVTGKLPLIEQRRLKREAKRLAKLNK